MAQNKKADKKTDLKKEEEKKTSEKKSDTSAKSDKKSSDKKPTEKKPSAFSKLAKYFKECKSEIKKIVWPTPKATFKNMGIVLVVLLVTGLIIYGLDTGFVALLGLIMDIGSNG